MPENLSATCAAIADPTRRAVIARLARGEATVGELAAMFTISAPAISRHLKVLEHAGLIERTRVAQWRHCRLRPQPLLEVLDWIAEHCPRLAPKGDMAHSRMLEMLAFISTEIHKQFGRTFFPTSDAERDAALEKADQRLAYIASRMKGDYLFGSEMTVPDAYLYVMLRWAVMKGRTLPDPLPAYKARMEARPSVQLALQHEGLDKK